MLNLPESIKALFKRDSVRKNFRAHFPNGEFSDITNDDVVAESLKFSESLCSQKPFKFGCAEASVLEFEAVGVGNMYGMTIEAGIEIDTSSLSAADISTIQAGTWDGTLVLAADSDIGYGFFRVPLGVFRVESCPRNHGAMAHRQVTAYSVIVANKLNFPNYMLWSKILARPSAILGTFGCGLTVSKTLLPSDATSWAYGDGRAGFNSAGKNVSVRIKETNDVKIYNSFVDRGSPAYMKAELNGYDAEAYSNIGKKIAAALDAAGYDFTYNAAKKKVYSSNLEALMRWSPHFFTPIITYDASYTDDGRYDIYDVSQTVTPGELVPIVCSQFDINSTGWGFMVPVSIYRLNSFRRYGYFSRNDLTKSLWLTIIEDGTEIATIRIPPDADPAGCVLTNPVIYTYAVADDPEVFDIGSTGEEKAQFYRTFSNDGGTTITQKTALNLKTFPYAAFDPMDMANGVLELNAQFAKMDRLGGVEVVRLDNSSPQSVLPENYKEVWWDEYDVDAVGAVLVSYRGAEDNGTATEIAIGSGTSIYDMSDNAALQTINPATLGSITTLVNSKFAPYANDVEFTPVEMTMQGWPWLEAGDALEITAEDGTVVNTYAMRVEMSGIQNLSATITAQGGQVIREV